MRLPAVASIAWRGWCGFCFSTGLARRVGITSPPRPSNWLPAPTPPSCPSQHVPRIGRRARRKLTNALNAAWSGIRMPSSLPARQQRLRRRWGYRGVRVGEALHPGLSPGTPLHPAIGRGRSPSPADDEARPLRRRVAPPPDVVRCFCPVPGCAREWNCLLSPQKIALRRQSIGRADWEKLSWTGHLCFLFTRSWEMGRMLALAKRKNRIQTMNSFFDSCHRYWTDWMRGQVPPLGWGQRNSIDRDNWREAFLRYPKGFGVSHRSRLCLLHQAS